MTAIEPGGVVTVRFASDGSERRLMLDYAPLERISVIEVQAGRAGRGRRARSAPIWHYFGSRPEAEEIERFGDDPARRAHAGGGRRRARSSAAPARTCFDTTVPGGAQVATAGVMAVGVLPTHRRRGVLTAMMRRQLADAHERGEPIATLYAARGRHLRPLRLRPRVARRRHRAAEGARAALARRAARAGAAARARTSGVEVLPAIYDRVQAETPGMFTRSRDWWQVRRLRQRPGKPAGQMRS